MSSTHQTDKKEQKSTNNALMTPSAQALALSPPRAPPHDSAHRTLMLAKNPSDYALAHHHDHEVHHRYFATIRHRLEHLLERAHLRLPTRIPHPHLPAAPEWGDRITRLMGVTLPLPLLNACRDSGTFRMIVDSLVTTMAPTLALSNPMAVVKFAALSKRCHEYKYGPHDMQVIHMLFPNAGDYEGLRIRELSGLLFFVHGGAWGSGLPWMYRLVASPFLNLGMAVAIVGYQTYPDGSIKDQVDDLEQAAAFLGSKFPHLCTLPPPSTENPSHYGTCLMGHSSGAHIALIMLVDRVKKQLQTPGTSERVPLTFHSYVGLSGPYDISHHFDFEAARGVEELSPMKPVCGYSRKAFRHNSPALRLMSSLTQTSKEASLQQVFPRMLLVHGIEDCTVPFTATSEAARIFRSCGLVHCDEAYVAKIGHQDTIMEMMLEGETRDTVIEWLKDPSRVGSRLAINSRL